MTEKGIQLGGGIFVQYRRSCGFCKHHRKAVNFDNGYPLEIVGFCGKAYLLENDNDETVTSAYRKLAKEDKFAFNQKYSVAPNVVCEDRFIPVSNRYELI